MHPLLKLLSDIPLIVYYTIEGIILFFIPNRLRFKDITGETALITGAGSGIGREMSLEFANRRARLILLDINKRGLQETKELVEKTSSTNVDVFVYECDVSNRKAVYSVAAKIKDEVGIVTILVNNAGIITGNLFLDCPDDMIQKTMEINTMAHFWTCKAFLPDMKAANHGHIVFVSSVAGFGPAIKMVDYCASKHAVAGLEECLRMELEHEGYNGIKTTIIAPFFVKTGLFEGLDFSMIPKLSANWVAKQIISGVLVDQEVVFIPGWFAFLITLKALIPRRTARQVYESCGLMSCLKTFKGTQKMD